MFTVTLVTKKSFVQLLWGVDSKSCDHIFSTNRTNSILYFNLTLNFTQLKKNFSHNQTAVGQAQTIL